MFSMKPVGFLLVAAALFVTVGVHSLMVRRERDLEYWVSQMLVSQRLPREHLRLLAEEKKLNLKLLNKIVACESSWRMADITSSSAYGYFQIIDSTEKITPQFQEGKRKFDSLANIEMGVYLFDRFGAFPWYESKPCWGGGQRVSNT